MAAQVHSCMSVSWHECQQEKELGVDALGIKRIKKLPQCQVRETSRKGGTKPHAQRTLLKPVKSS
eukprot:2548706-Karenia_brevis.AAC.1